MCLKWLTTADLGTDTGRRGTDTAAAGDTMVFVSISETYDLSTKTNKMSLLAIHTPDKDIIQKTYPGLCMNSKYCRIVKQDVVLACASALPLSADIVGTGADMVAPEDAFNPILFKAVSNESMSTLEARLAGLHNVAGTTFGSQVLSENDNVTGLSDEFNVYYALLSNRDGFRTANPQQGLAMRGLVPLVFEKYYNYGVNASRNSDQFPVESENPQGGLQIANNNASAMRGRAHPMPRFNTTYLTGISRSPDSGNTGNGMLDDSNSSRPLNSQVHMPDIMPVYTACIVMPPSRLHQLFYRMVVTTTLEFTEVRPIQEIASFQSLSTDYAPMVYHSDYSVQSKVMTATAGMVDAKDADIKKIMEGA